MATQFSIPQGEQTVTVELTVKQAMALSGVRFNENPRLMADARRQIKSILDRSLLTESDKIHYHNLRM